MYRDKPFGSEEPSESSSDTVNLRQTNQPATMESGSAGSAITLSSLHSKDRCQSMINTMPENGWLILPLGYPEDLLARAQEDRASAVSYQNSNNQCNAANGSSGRDSPLNSLINCQQCGSDSSSSTGSYNTCPTSQHSNNIPE